MNPEHARISDEDRERWKADFLRQKEVLDRRYRKRAEITHEQLLEEWGLPTLVDRYVIVWVARGEAFERLNQANSREEWLEAFRRAADRDPAIAVLLALREAKNHADIQSRMIRCGVHPQYILQAITTAHAFACTDVKAKVGAWKSKYQQLEKYARELADEFGGVMKQMPESYARDVKEFVRTARRMIEFLKACQQGAEMMIPFPLSRENHGETSVRQRFAQFLTNFFATHAPSKRPCTPLVVHIMAAVYGMDVDSDPAKKKLIGEVKRAWQRN